MTPIAVSVPGNGLIPSVTEGRRLPEPGGYAFMFVPDECPIDELVHAIRHDRDSLRLYFTNRCDSLAAASLGDESHTSSVWYVQIAKTGE